MGSEQQYYLQKYHPKQPPHFVRREGRKPLSALNLFCCCPGYGKSAYLYQLWTENDGAIYLSLNRGDNSEEMFSELLKGIIPDSEAEMTEKPVFRLIDFLTERKNALLLIDNADMITDDGAAEWLTILTEAARQGNFRMVAASRTIPFYWLPFVMEGSVQLFGIEELRLTETELRKLADTFRQETSELSLHALEQFSGGWAVAAAELLRQQGTDWEKSLCHTYLSPYLTENMLKDLSEDCRAYLMKTAFLPPENETFTTEVLGLPEGGMCLSELIRRGIVPDGAVPVYPEAMRRIISALLSSAAKQQLTEAASDYYIRHQQFAQAVRLFEESGNIQGAERLLKLYGATLLENCELELIGYCGRIINARGRVTEPEALGALAQYYYYSGDYDNMERAYNLADSMFGKENPYSVYRRLYKGLLRYEMKPELYRTNVTTALVYLKEHDLPLPFLYQKESDLLHHLTDNLSEQTLPQLIVRRFGGLKLLAGEQQTEIQCKTKRSAELIAYLMEHPSRSVGREELLHAFWPEEMPANAVAMLHNMIYHLRRELSPYGLENVIGYQNKSYRLERTMIHDADSDIVLICQASEKNDREKVLSLQQTAAVYWGTYLGAIDIPWANERREYYDRCYGMVCQQLAEYYRTAGQSSRELEFLKNAFRLEPYSEQLLHDLLFCFVALGQPEKARRYYEDYAARLDAEFGTRPSKWLRNSFLSCFSEKET